MMEVRRLVFCARCGEADRAPGQGYCLPCKAVVVREWREAMTLRPTREFPGVDIDAIHRKR